MPPKVITVVLSAFAAGSSSLPTSPGRIAMRAGEFRPKKACCAANSPRITHTLFQPSHACRKNRKPSTINPIVETISTARRSKASATAPPHNPKMTSGTSPNNPVSPT